MSESTPAAPVYTSQSSLTPGMMDTIRQMIPHPPRGVLYLRGPRGSGKTTLGSILLKRHPELFCHLSRRWPTREGEVPDPEGRRLLPNEYAARKAAGEIIGEVITDNFPSGVALEDLKSAVASGRVIVTESILTAAMLRDLWPAVKIERIAILPIDPTVELTLPRQQELIETLSRRLKARKPDISQEQLGRALGQAIERYRGVVAASDPVVINPDGAWINDVYVRFEPLALRAMENIWQRARPSLHEPEGRPFFVPEQLDNKQAPDSPIDVWKRAWEARLEESRLIWGSNYNVEQAFQAAEAPIATDPWEAWRHSKVDLGFLYYFKTALPSEVEGLCVPRHLAPRLRGRTLFHEIFNLLMQDAEHRNLVVVPNRWPRVPYQVMLISNNWQPQRLNPEYVSAQLDWASRGAVAEFHRRALPVNHLHGHLLLPEFVPITRYTAGFVEERVYAGLRLGMLQNHPLSQIALLGENRAVLERAILIFSEGLEASGRWFHEVVVKDPSTDRLIALFTLWKKRTAVPQEPIFQRARVDGVDLSIGFNASGVLRSSPQVNLDADTVVGRLKNYLMEKEEVHHLRETLWDAWRKAADPVDPAAGVRRGVRPEPTPIDSVLAAFRASNPAWDHAHFSALSDQEQQEVFCLYVKRYAGQWMKFQTDEEGFQQFRAFYQEAFFLKLEGRITAFVLARNRGANLVLNLGAAEAGSARTLMTALPAVFDVSGVYGLVSGLVMDSFMKNNLRLDDLLSARKQGRFAFTAFPVVNPRLASLLLDSVGNLGIVATPEADGVHCSFTPNSPAKTPTKALLLGSPLVDNEVAHRYGVQVVLEDSFLVGEKVIGLLKDFNDDAAKAPLVHQELTELIQNGHLFSVHPLETKIRRPEIKSLLNEPGFLNDVLEIWRIKIWRMRVLAALLQIADRDPALARPSTDELNRVSKNVAEFEQALALMSELKEDTIARKTQEFSCQTRDEWSRRCRVILTERFRMNTPLVAQGKDGLRCFLKHKIQSVKAIYTIGLGGPSGVGKSSLGSALVEHLSLDDRDAHVIATDGFLTDTCFAGDIRVLEVALQMGRFEETIWNMKSYRSFLEQIRTFKSARCLSGTLIIDDYYDRLIKKRIRKVIPVTQESVFIVEGWVVLPSPMNNAFDLTIFMDVSDDEILRDRMVAREPGKKEKLLRRFSVLDRPFAASLALKGDYRRYNYLLDQTDFEAPVLYTIPESNVPEGAGGSRELDKSPTEPSSAPLL